MKQSHNRVTWSLVFATLSLFSIECFAQSSCQTAKENGVGNDSTLQAKCSGYEEKRTSIRPADERYGKCLEIACPTMTVECVNKEPCAQDGAELNRVSKEWEKNWGNLVFLCSTSAYDRKQARCPSGLPATDGIAKSEKKVNPALPMAASPRLTLTRSSDTDAKAVEAARQKKAAELRKAEDLKSKEMADTKKLADARAVKARDDKDRAACAGHWNMCGCQRFDPNPTKGGNCSQ
jgi:hypothetical protein